MPCTPSDNATLTFYYATKERLATGVIVEVGRPRWRSLVSVATRCLGCGERAKWGNENGVSLD